MEHLKEAIHLQGYAQKDPLVEYKNEAFQSFEQLKTDIQFEIATNIFRVEVAPPTPLPVARSIETSGPVPPEEGHGVSVNGGGGAAVPERVLAGRSVAGPGAAGRPAPDRGRVREVLVALGLPADARAQALSPEAFRELDRRLAAVAPRADG